MLRGLRERLILRLLQRIRRITHRLPVVLREVQRGTVLVIAPHMDDDVIGPGGTLVLHKRAGSKVHVVFCAAGATPEQDRTRKAEARAAEAYMDFDSVTFLDFPEGRLSLNEETMSERLATLLREIQPDYIFCPYFADHHRDHSAVTIAAGKAVESAQWSGEVWAYEVWSPLWPNYAVDITPVADAKREALQLYESQVSQLHYVDGILGLNSYRGLRVYVKFAEAYFVSDEKEFIEQSQSMNVV